VKCIKLKQKISLTLNRWITFISSPSRRPWELMPWRNVRRSSSENVFL